MSRALQYNLYYTYVLKQSPALGQRTNCMCISAENILQLLLILKTEVKICIK